MSDLSSLKNESPTQNQFEKAREALHNPFALAVLASLGVHVLLWFGLPLLPSSTPKTSDQPRTLGVVELSPLEQARLPQTALQPLPSPDLSKSTTSSNSAVPMPPPDPTIITPTPDSTTYYPIPGLEQRDRSSTSTETTKKTTTKPDRTAAKSSSAKTTSSTQASTTTAEGTTEPDDSTADEFTGNARKLLDPSGKEYSKSRDEQAKLAAAYAYSSAGTSTSDPVYVANSGAIGSEISTAFGVADWEKPLKAKAAYPQEACKFQHDGKPIKGETGVAVVLQPDSKLAEKIWVLKKSGFVGLDEAAVKFIRSQWSQIAKQNEIKAGSKPKAFAIGVTLEPTEADCAAAKPVS